MGILRLGGGGGLAFAFMFDVIALATPGWIYVDDGGNGYAQGLFQNYSGPNITDANQGDAEKVAAAFNVMGVIILFCAMLAMCFSGAKKNEVIAKVGGVLSFVAGIFIMIGMASYTGLYSDFVSQSNVDWGYSFAFGWLAFTICIIAAPLAFIDRDD